MKLKHIGFLVVGVFFLFWIFGNRSYSKEEYVLQKRVEHLQQISRKLRQEAQEIIDDLETIEKTCGGSFSIITQDKIPFDNWRTTWKCYRLEDQSEICTYNNLCYDGDKILFLNPLTPYHSNIYNNPLIGRESEVEIDWLYFMPSPNPPPPSDFVPYGSPWRRNTYVVNPTSLSTNSHTLEHLKGAFYFTTYSDQDNLINSTISGMNLWESQFLNDTLSDQDKLPPQDFVVIRRPQLNVGWERDLYLSLVQPHTQFLFDSWFEAGYTPVDSKREIVRQNKDVAVSEKNIICMDKAVIVSKKPSVFSGIRSSAKFRQKVLGAFDMQLTPVGIRNWRTGYMQVKEKVVIDLSGGNSQPQIINYDQIIALVEYYQLEAVIIPPFSSYSNIQGHIRDMKDADVYIAVHGDGVMNTFFMHPRSALIEIFPFGMHSPFYKNLAGMLDLHYIGVESYLKGPSAGCAKDLFTKEYQQLCQLSSNLAMSSKCENFHRQSCTIAPVYNIELALINAYDYIGINLHTRVPEMFSISFSTTPNNFHTNES